MPGIFDTPCVTALIRKEGALHAFAIAAQEAGGERAELRPRSLPGISDTPVAAALFARKERAVGVQEDRQ